MRFATFIFVLFAAAFSPAAAADALQEARQLYLQEAYQQAFELLGPIAAAGNADAQYLIGVMYANGQGVEQNFYQAGQLYRLAGNQGHAGAQINLASLFEECYGNGPCNAEEAARWYRRAADQGNAIAQHNLGVMYATGAGVAQDEWTSKILFRRAAEQGYTPAQYNLAVTYEDGFGGPVDLLAAFAWYDLAAAGEFAGAGERRDRLLGTFNEEEKSRAVRLSALLAENYGNLDGIFF